MILDTRTLTITPDSYGLLDLGGLRPTLTRPEKGDSRAPAPLLLSIRDECCVQPLLISPHTVRGLHRADAGVNAVEEYKQRPEVCRIPLSVVRRPGHAP